MCLFEREVGLEVGIPGGSAGLGRGFLIPLGNVLLELIIPEPTLDSLSL